MKRAATLAPAQVRTPSVIADYVELAKPRITLMVVLTAAVGFFMASRSGLSVWGLVHTMVGTALIAASASVLNQVIERDADAKMVRTANRALPTGRIGPEQGLAYGIVLGWTGALYVLAFLNLTVALIAIATLASYVFLYTPLKRITTLNTLVGAIPGALPPVGGWAAASGGVSREAWSLFLIVFLWQIPHFLALAWLVRNDYMRAGFRMLTVVDPTGRITGRHVVLGALALIPVSLTPTLLGMTGAVYFAGALALGLAYGAVALWMAWSTSSRTARWLFLTSILYLPALMAVMMIDRLPG